MASEREKALSRDAAARARLADDPVHQIKQRRDAWSEPMGPDELDARHLRAQRDRDAPLTEVEIEVLRLAADGLSNSEIGAALFKSKQTVMSQIRRVLVHLEARDRAHAVAIALRRGLID